MKVQWVAKGPSAFTLIGEDDVVYAEVVGQQKETIEATASDLTERFSIPHPTLAPYHYGQARLWAQEQVEGYLGTRLEYLYPEDINPTPNERWACGFGHDWNSLRIYEAVEKFDFRHNNDFFDWSSGGDGDNGEQLLYLLDMYFHEKGSK